MSSQFQTMTLDGALTTDEVRRKFGEALEKDRYENGHSFSGGFGQARGIAFRSMQFQTIDAATEWLCEHAEKWEEALCVKAVDADEKLWNGKPNLRHGKAVWVIGAWCAS